MTNACFRCKEPIESGRTFCGACREGVSLEFSYTRESRAWLLVAVGAALQVLLIVGSTAATVYSNPGGPLAEVLGVGLAAGSAMAFLVSPVVAYGLLKDAQHVEARADADWNPSNWAYYAFAALSMFVLPSPFVAAYHLRKRRAAIGLRVRRYEE